MKNQEPITPPTPDMQGNFRPTPPPPPFNPVMPPKKQRDPLGTKILLIAVISAVLMIPSLIISSLVSDREYTLNSTVGDISDSWSGRQVISGPIITIPYDSISKKNNGGLVRLLPDRLDIDADIKSQELHRGIYEAVVYNSDVTAEGNFSFEPLRKLGIPMSAYRFSEAYVTIGIGDLRGVEEISPFAIGAKSYELEGTNNSKVYSDYDVDDEIEVRRYRNEHSPGTGCMQANISITPDDSTSIPFKVTMKLRGSGSFGVTPIGHRNKIEIEGTCKSPSFKGMFLPSERKVEDGEFEASWTLNSTNRDYPQAFIGSRAADIAKSAVSVSLLIPVDRYQKTDRAVKYAIVVILLTFIAILFAEVMLRHPINLLQYLLVGLALILFYSLLLSLSEHLSFGLSYLIASIMTIGLITAYMRGVLKSARTAYAIEALLFIIYGFIFVLLSLETFALLTGSIGLFLALAAVMYATLKLRIENR